MFEASSKEDSHLLSYLSSTATAASYVDVYSDNSDMNHSVSDLRLALLLIQALFGASKGQWWLARACLESYHQGSSQHPSKEFRPLPRSGGVPFPFVLFFLTFVFLLFLYHFS